MKIMSYYGTGASRYMGINDWVYEYAPKARDEYISEFYEWVYKKHKPETKGRISQSHFEDIWEEWKEYFDDNYDYDDHGGIVLNNSKYVKSSTVEEDLIADLEKMDLNKIPPVMMYGRLVRKAEQNGLTREKVGRWTVSQWIDYLKSIKSSSKRNLNNSKKIINSGYMGIDDVKYISHGEWADPELEYDGIVANYWDVEDYLVDLAKEEGVNTDDDDEYSKWVIKNADEVRYAVTYFGSSDEEIESGCHGKKKGKKNIKSVKVVDDIYFRDFEPWSGAVDTFDLIIENDKDREMDEYLDELYPDGLTATQLNDLLWFDADSILDMLGIEDDDEDDDEIESGCHGKKKGKKNIKSFARRNIANARLVEGEECVIQVKDKDGRWKDVGYYKDPPYWSFSKGNPKMFNSHEEAMKSKLMKAVKDAGYSEEAGNLRLAD